MSIRIRRARKSLLCLTEWSVDMDQKTVGLIVGFINTIVLIVPVFFTENVLNRTFDKDGKRKAE